MKKFILRCLTSRTKCVWFGVVGFILCVLPFGVGCGLSVGKVGSQLMDAYFDISGAFMFVSLGLVAVGILLSVCVLGYYLRKKMWMTALKTLIINVVVANIVIVFCEMTSFCLWLRLYMAFTESPSAAG